MKITEDFTFFIVALMGLSFIIVMATIENSEHLKIACFESNKTYINQDGMEFCGDMEQIKGLVNDINNIKQPPYDINYDAVCPGLNSNKSVAECIREVENE